MSSSASAVRGEVRRAQRRTARVWAAVGFLILLVVWIAVSLVVGETRLPPPWKIVTRFFTTATSCPEISFQGAGNGGFLPHVGTTLSRYLIGVLSGALLSFVMMFFTARFRAFRELFEPVIDVLRAIPPLALAPFFLLWFGTSPIGIVAISIFYCFTMIYVAGVEAMDKMPPAQVNFARTLGAGRTTSVLSVLIPGVLPSMAGPIKVAFSWSWGLVIVGEQLGAKNGIGRILNAFIAILSTDLVIVGILWILILAVAMELVLDGVLRRLLRWNEGER